VKLFRLLKPEFRSTIFTIIPVMLQHPLETGARVGPAGSSLNPTLTTTC